MTPRAARHAPDDSAWRLLLARLLERNDLQGFEGIALARIARTGKPTLGQLELLRSIARRLGVQP